MAVLLQGQVFGLCRCFDGLPYLLDQCMCLPVLFVDHLQSPSQLCQQCVVSVGKFPHLLGFYFGQGSMPLQMLQQSCYLSLRAFRGLCQPLDPFQLDIIQTCISCAACFGVFDGFDKRFLEVFIHLDREVDLIFINLLAELNYKRFMFKKLCILLIFSKLNEIKHLIDKYRMHNLYAIFAKLLNICKQIAGNLVNESGNVPRRGVVPKFSDLEVVALNMASEAVGIDSESLLFANLQEYRVEIPNLISRRQYNDRRKITSSLCNAIRERMVAKMDGGEDYFCIDSKPIEVCRIARSKRCSMGKKDFSKAPGVGYCASQSMYYYGYKLHAVCGLSGVIHSFDLTKASVHDIHYLKDVKVDYSNCTVIGDRGYISAQVQLDLFETANIRLEVPYRCNQKEWKPTFPAFAKARKRIETIFSQLCDQFMIIRNYAKDTDGLFARIIGKISALTILQYINYKNEKPIGRVKYALF